MKIMPISDLTKVLQDYIDIYGKDAVISKEDTETIFDLLADDWFFSPATSGIDLVYSNKARSKFFENGGLWSSL